MHTITVAVADARGQISESRSRPAIYDSPMRSVKALRPLITEALRAAKVPRSRIEGVGCHRARALRSGVGRLRAGAQPGLARLPGARGAGRRAGHAGHRQQHHPRGRGRRGARRRGARRALVRLCLRRHGASAPASSPTGGCSSGSAGCRARSGHCPVVADGPVCGCGRRGCLETVASTMALTRAAEQAIAGRRADPAARVRDARRGGASRRRRARAIALSRRLLAEAGEHLGRGISYLLNILNPEMVVLAGPYVAAGEVLLGAAARFGGAARDPAPGRRDRSLDAGRARGSDRRRC